MYCEKLVPLYNQMFTSNELEAESSLYPHAPLSKWPCKSSKNGWKWWEKHVNHVSHSHLPALFTHSHINMHSRDNFISLNWNYVIIQWQDSLHRMSLKKWTNQPLMSLSKNPKKYKIKTNLLMPHLHLCAWIWLSLWHIIIKPQVIYKSLAHDICIQHSVNDRVY